MERVQARRDNVLRLWAYLLELLRARRARLELSLQLQQNFQVYRHMQLFCDRFLQISSKRDICKQNTLL